MSAEAKTGLAVVVVALGILAGVLATKSLIVRTAFTDATTEHAPPSVAK